MIVMGVVLRGNARFFCVIGGAVNTVNVNAA